jgi:FkbM family methyltransferase
MRIFVDVGSHYGESVYKALNPDLGFDRIFTYEPSTTSCERLLLINDARLVVKKMALGAKEGTIDLFNSGSLGASTFSDKRGLSTDDKETVILRSASAELSEILTSGAEVFVKINCEGGELDILEDLKQSGLIVKCTHLYVDWDARKIPSLAQRYAVLRAEIEEINIDLVSSDFLPVSGWKGVELWLSGHKIRRSGTIEDFQYKSFSFLPLKYRAREILKRYTPFLFVAYVEFLKRIQRTRRNK